jgi:hypothetical protein
MPKPKHRRKADGKTVPHPGRKRGGAALVIIEEAKREAAGLPPQKDVTGLPLFAAPTPRIRGASDPRPAWA